MSAASPMRLQSYEPATFRDRGLAVPFTTPMLAGARVRPAIRSCGAAADAAPDRRVAVPSLELLVPNPSGGRGVYVLAWANRRSLGSVTVHDTQLGAALELHLQTNGALAPPVVRRIARETALAGFAGRPAAAAAQAAIETAARRIAAARRRLSVALVRQIEGPRAAPPELDAPDILDWRTMSCLERLTGGTQAPADTLFAGLQAIGAAASALGPHADGDTDAATPDAVVERLAAMQDALKRGGPWAQADPGRGRAPATLVAGAAEVTVGIGRRLLLAAQRRLADVAPLLAAWARTPEPILEDLYRPAWALDGWDRICALWDAADGHGDQMRALAEMAVLVPPLPDEADAWLGMPAGTLTRSNAAFHRVSPAGQVAAGSSGPAHPGAGPLELISRNEALRAAAA